MTDDNKGESIDIQYPEEDSFISIVNRGTALAMQGDNLGALSYLERAYAIDPNNDVLIQNLFSVLGRIGLSEAHLGNFVGAAPYLERALALRPRHPEVIDFLFNVVFSHGTAIGSQGLYEEALPYLNRAIALKPDHPDAVNNLFIALRHCGTNLANQERIEEALPYFDRAAALKPEDAAAVADLFTATRFIGYRLLQQGDAAGALPHLEQAHRLKPQDAPAQRALFDAHTRIAVAMAVQENWGPAARHLEKACVLEPGLSLSVLQSLQKISNENEATVLATALSIHQRDDIVGAMALYSRIIELNSRNHHALHLIGVAIMQLFSHEGEKLVRKSIEVTGDYPAAINNIDFLSKIITGHKTNADTQYFYNREEHSEYPSSYTYSSSNTVGRWSTMRMFDAPQCLAPCGYSWLTVGDTSGQDSIHLKECGIESVTASSLDDKFLKLGHAAGFIDSYLALNAESIDLPDQAFDFVLCKEALHHMQRPMMAIYEMLRVARVGVLLVEPLDPVIDLPRAPNLACWHTIDGNVFTSGLKGNDEAVFTTLIDWDEDEAGNYVFSLSVRELKKLANALGLPFLGWKKFNSYYDQNLVNSPATDDSEDFAKFKEQIEFRDRLSNAGVMSPTYITGLLLKRPLPLNILNDLRNIGFSLNRIPTRRLALNWPDLNAGPKGA